MKPRLYDKDNPIKWRELEFDELLRLIEGRVNYHIHKQNNMNRAHGGQIPQFKAIEGDDMRQELVFALWKKLDRIPSDIIVFDFRFLKYIDMIFRRTIIDLYRSKTYIDKKTGERVVRDELNRAVALTEELEDVL